MGGGGEAVLLQKKKEAEHFIYNILEQHGFTYTSTSPNATDIRAPSELVTNKMN